MEKSKSISTNILLVIYAVLIAHSIFRGILSLDFPSYVTFFAYLSQVFAYGVIFCLLLKRNKLAYKAVISIELARLVGSLVLGAVAIGNVGTILLFIFLLAQSLVRPIIIYFLVKSAKKFLTI